MPLNKKLFIALSIFTIFSNQILFSQNQYGRGQERSGEGNRGTGGIGSISGFVVDKQTLQAVEYANLTIFRSKDSVMVGGAITNQKGSFTIEKVPFGNYYMVVSFIGYSSLKIPNIIVNPKDIDKKMGQIKFSPSSNTLNEVNVIGEKRMMEYTLDKKIVNVDKNLVSAGGSAVDVMQNIPAVTVDIDGNVSLRGSTNVNILIDGRPSSLSGMSRQAILEQIPASSIEAIEIITNPSAKYNPEGMSGIINIRLKKKTAQGLNGMVSTSIGTNNRYNSSINLNYSTEKINVFASWDGRWNQGKGYGDTYRIATLKDTSSYTTQHSEMKRIMDNNTVKAGFDWYINSKNTITLMGQYNVGGSERNQDLFSFTKDFNFIKENDYKQHNKEIENDNSNMFALNYKKTFTQRGRELTADFSYSTSKNSENTDMTLNNFLSNYQDVSMSSKPSLQKQYDDGNNWVGNASINYVHPFAKKMKLETGYQGIFRNVDDDFRLEKYDTTSLIYVNDIFSSNHFKYKENINAIYGTFSKEWESISMQLGLRLEEANTTAEQLTQKQTFTNNYFSIYPSVHISKKLARKNEIQFSYSRRVNRPDMHDLNPFKDYSNPLMIRYGNPYLKPEYINSFEVGHSKYWNKTSFYTSIYYRQINDVIKRIAFLDTNGISNMTNQNLTKGTSYGVDFILEQEVLKWWRINANFSYFRTMIEGNSIDGNISTDNYSWTSKLNSTMNFGKTLSIQISGNYRAPIITPQGKMHETYSADIAFKKDLFKEKFSVSFRVSDIFNTQKWNNDTHGTGFSASMSNKRQSQAAFLTISYKINGGLKAKPRKKVTENGNGNGTDEGDF
ncbi:MAG: TonB-dependent receptor [Bacteroidetes bacterium]|nr:TonB-dependent receptor [Bacteroidota bacterium]